MTEDFLYYQWKYKLIDPNQRLTSGETIVIIDPGQRNENSGPDFFNARIRIGDTLWAGNVEIHVLSSDWMNHGHQHDKAFDNVILHVVYRHDREIRNKNRFPIPTLELEGKISTELFAVYQQLMINRSWIPCAHLLPYASLLAVHGWLDRLIVERQERKVAEIRQSLVFTGNDWNESFYQLLGKNFGFRVNAVAFHLLVKSLPLSIINRHKGDHFQIEALLFGQAGMLKQGYRSQYYLKLKREYEFLSAKYSLSPMDGHVWKFMRMRPSNFPTLRISQFAALLSGSSFLFSTILEVESFNELQKLFKVKASQFWDTHYTFKTRSPVRGKMLGTAAVQLILINTMIPFLYLYGKDKNKEELCQRALRFLEQIPGERNSISRKWEELNMPVRSAYHTQALLELKERYCQRKRCLECVIGNSILKSTIH